MNKKHAAVEREKKMSNQRQLNCRCCLCGGKLSDSVERTVVLFVRKETEKEGERKRWRAGLKEEAAEFFTQVGSRILLSFVPNRTTGGAVL